MNARLHTSQRHQGLETVQYLRKLCIFPIFHVEQSYKTIQYLQGLKSNMIRVQTLQPHAGLKRPGLTSLILDEADLILSMPGYESDLQCLAPKVCNDFIFEGFCLY